MNVDLSGPLDPIATDAASQLVKLAVTDGWVAAKRLLSSLSKKHRSSVAKVDLPEPESGLDEEFTRRLSAYLQSQVGLSEAIRKHLIEAKTGGPRVEVRGKGQAAVLGSGIQNNNFGDR